MNILKSLGLLLVIATMTGCTSIRYTNVGTIPAADSTKRLVVLSISEKVPEGCVKVADFDHRESLVSTWEGLWKRFNKVAFDKNADILKISEVYTGNKNTKGATKRFLGSIYSSGNMDIKHYLDSLNSTNHKENKVWLYFTRNDWGGPSLFTIDLYIDSVYHGKFTKRVARIIELDKEGEITISSTGKPGTGLKINVEYGKSYYIIARQMMNSVVTPNSLMVSQGGPIFIVQDEKYGLLEFDILKFNIDFDSKN